MSFATILNYVNQFGYGKLKSITAKDFSGITHLILMEKPHETAERVKAFLKS